MVRSARPAALVLALLIAALAAGGAVALAILQGPGGGEGPVYTVARLQAAAGRPGSGLDGATVSVRGYVWHGTMAGMGIGSDRWIFALADGQDAPDSSPTVMVTIGPEDRWLSRLRRLPMIGSLAPQPQAVAMSSEATYRLRLSLVTDLAVCTARRPCIHAELLDAGQPAAQVVDAGAFRLPSQAAQ